MVAWDGCRRCMDEGHKGQCGFRAEERMGQGGPKADPRALSGDRSCTHRCRCELGGFQPHCEAVPWGALMGRSWWYQEVCEKWLRGGQ